jgi:uncharacterized membrane protein (DUF2068 family)
MRFERKHHPEETEQKNHRIACYGNMRRNRVAFRPRIRTVDTWNTKIGKTMHISRGIRTVAMLEGAKGVVVLLAGFGLFSLVHRDVQRFAEILVTHAHLDPASRTPRVFIEFARRIDDARLWQLAAGAMAYSAIRLIEAYGLWYGRTWGAALAAASGAVYLPFELRELAHHPSLLSLSLVALNLGIVGYMLYSLRRRTAPR